MKKQVEIIESYAVDITESPHIKRAGRVIVILQEKPVSVDGFLFSYDGKSIYVMKDSLKNNLKGPELRKTNIYGW